MQVSITPARKQDLARCFVGDAITTGRSAKPPKRQRNSTSRRSLTSRLPDRERHAGFQQPTSPHERDIRLKRTCVVASVVLSLAGVVGCSTSSLSDATSTSTSTTVVAGGEGATTVAETADHPGSSTTRANSPSSPTVTVPGTATTGSALEGSWKAEIQDLLSGGGSSGPSCLGTVTLTFRRGHLTLTGSGSCDLGSMQGTESYNTTATYRTDDGNLIVTNSSDNTHIEFNGQPLDVGGASAFGNGTVAYNVNGNVLTITLNDPDAGSLSQTFTRVP